MKKIDSIIASIKKKKTVVEKGYTEYEPVLLKFNLGEIKKFGEEFIWSQTKDYHYYHKIQAELDHLVYRYRNGWITSRRQLIIHSEDCMSAIHLVFAKKLNRIENSLQMNVFQRSSNLDNAFREDLTFLCRWLLDQFDQDDQKLNYFISIPHSFGNKKNKVENGI